SAAGNKIKAIHIGKAQINYQSIVHAFEGKRLRSFGVAGNIDAISGFAQRAIEEILDRPIVFDQQHSHGESRLGAVQVFTPSSVGCRQSPYTLTSRPTRVKASDQKAPEECMSSTTYITAATKCAICSEVATSGGAAFKTMKLLPQICVRMSCSRYKRITII